MPAAWPAVAAVKAKWPVSGGALSQMILGRCWGRGVTAVEPVGGDGVVRWDGAGDADRFRFDLDQPSAAAARAARPERGVSFSILYCGVEEKEKGFQEQGRGKDVVKLEEIGTAMISLEECCWEMQLQQQQKRGATQQQLVVVPIRVRKDGWASDAMLYVNVELVDANTPSENIGRTVSFRESRARTTTPAPTMRDNRKSLEAGTYHEVLDLKQLLDLADREHKVAVYSRSKRNSDSSSVSSMSSVSSSSTISISSASSSGGASPEPGLSSKRRLLPWRRKSRDFDKRSSESLSQELPMKYMDDDLAGSWETREFTSRDSETKLRTPVFFASIDQRDDSAGGESACTALVAVLAAALHANHPTMPTRPELDALIRDGSSEWRRLCDDEAHMAAFPNRHFDLETVEGDCYHVVDTLGERLFEGCDKAYMLRFDATSEMRSVSPPPSSPSPEEEVIVTGKECCREFIKRFLAAIPLREELEMERKGCADAPHRRLQIEFHFTVLKEEEQDQARR
ncbi:hypothetical protein OsJ_00723 [Oryza sativa Japonica Group]|uniref:Uncharacterized protein n=1 Tax=Oryza sativa subsp. japonica TaxID=39947 RepID=B9ETM2_ORYSJ|nr:hypothetical protein OsJ_00723 [Oryza sativa Japonica Group]